MANAIATLTLAPSIGGHTASRDETQTREVHYGTCGLSAGGTYQTTGVPLAWRFISSTGSVVPILTSQTQPQFASFFSTAGSSYQYVWDQVHNTLRIFQAGVELANGAAITADTIGFKAEYLRGV